MRKALPKLASLNSAIELDEYFNSFLSDIVAPSNDADVTQARHDAVSVASMVIRNKENAEILYRNNAKNFFLFLRKLNQQKHDGKSAFSPWYELRNSIFLCHPSEGESVSKRLLRANPQEFLSIIEETISEQVVQTQGYRKYSDIVNKSFLCDIFLDLAQIIFIEPQYQPYRAKFAELISQIQKIDNPDFLQLIEQEKIARSICESDAKSFFKLVAEFDNSHLKLFLQSAVGADLVKSNFEFFEQYILPKFASEQDAVNLYCGAIGEIVAQNKSELFFEQLTKFSEQSKNIMLASASGQAFIRKEFLDINAIMKKEEELNISLQKTPKDRFLIRANAIEIRTSPGVHYDAEFGRLNEICHNKVQTKVDVAAQSNVIIIPIDALMARMRANRENAQTPAAAPSLGSTLLRSMSGLGGWLLGSSMSTSPAAVKDI